MMPAAVVQNASVTNICKTKEVIMPLCSGGWVSGGLLCAADPGSAIFKPTERTIMEGNHPGLRGIAEEDCAQVWTPCFKKAAERQERMRP